MSDEMVFRELFERCCAGELAAIDPLYQEYYPHLCSVVGQRLRGVRIQGAVHPSDLVDDVMLRMLRRPEALDLDNQKRLLRYVERALDARAREVLRQLIARRRDLCRTESRPIEELELEDSNPGPAEVAMQQDFREWAISNDTFWSCGASMSRGLTLAADLPCRPNRRANGMPGHCSDWVAARLGRRVPIPDRLSFAAVFAVAHLASVV
jgi:hypothetical protein